MREAEIVVTNECSLTRVGPDCKSIVEAAVESYRRNLERLLVSIRLIGSAARGENVFGVSDMAFVGLVSMNPDGHQRDMLTADSRRLTRTSQCASLVDLGIEIKGRVAPLREFIFRTDSVCLWGDDAYSAAETKMPSASLAKLTSPDFDKLMSGYRSRLKGSFGSEELGRIGRTIGKELLWCFRRYLVLNRGVYRKSAADIHGELLTYYPREAETFTCLFRIHEQPVARKDELLEILKMAHASRERLEKLSG